MHTLFGHLGALYVLFRGRLKTSALTGRLLARYVLLRFWSSESVPPERRLQLRAGLTARTKGSFPTS